MNELKELWAKKYEKQGRINITVFFVNIFLLLCHVFLMIMYVIIGHKFMIYVNIGSLLVYVFSIPGCYKKIDRYMGIAFLEIWIHLICGILSFGWTPCYQNWCFGIIAAYFLPAFSSNNNSKHRPLFYSIIVIFTYFFLATFYPLINLDITVELNIYMNSILFIANNMFVFITIALFALFYTSNRDRKELELSRKADYDQLTELYNRRAINQLSDQIIKTSKETKKSYYIAILDIDFFKKVNDTYGHNAGDIVLKKVASIIKAFSIRGIIPGRWGGEEFVMLAPHTMKYKDFIKTLEILRIKISEVKFDINDNKKINITVSIGAAEIKNYRSLEESIKKADERLYKAKQTGRNKLVK